ncbi:diphthamide biosynthesis protein 2-related domain protein [Thermoplasmatales archaeon BRNA1]|nr:diphthamide biosynthesis protein 2-related domain protein [Thermoplasmatales archaeon BRNA1]
MLFDLQIDTIESWIRGRGFTSVALQLPEGLKIRATELSDRIFKDTGSKVVILGYPCYGACDLFVDYKRYAQGLVHFGHSPIPNLPRDDDVLYVEARADVDISSLADSISELPSKIGLLASVQYVHLLPEAKRILEESGRTAVIGKGDDRIFYPGQVLGCNCSSAISVQEDVEAFLFLGEGDFHPLAATFGVAKHVFIYNPVTKEMRSVDDVKDRILRRRFAAIESARSAQSFLVIVCGKIGQCRMDAADRIEQQLRDAGKTVYRLVTDEITPNALIPFKVDAYVSTACPRVAMDDQAKYQHPMLTIPEAETVLGLRTWDDYVFDSI